MLAKLFSDKFIKKLSDKITESVDKSLESYQKRSEMKLNSILEHVESLRVEVKNIDSRLTTKEIKDHSDYGHVQYKISSLQSELIEKKKKQKAS